VPYPQQQPNGLCPEADEFSLHIYTLFKINFNIILPPTYRHSGSLLPSSFLTSTMLTFLISATRSTYPVQVSSSCDYCNNIWGKIQIINFLTVYFLRSRVTFFSWIKIFCHLVPLPKFEPRSYGLNKSVTPLTKWSRSFDCRHWMLISDNLSRLPRQELRLGTSSTVNVVYKFALSLNQQMRMCLKTEECSNEGLG
jgi:hypothetical protein